MCFANTSVRLPAHRTIDSIHLPANLQHKLLYTRYAIGLKEYLSRILPMNLHFLFSHIHTHYQTDAVAAFFVVGRQMYHIFVDHDDDLITMDKNEQNTLKIETQINKLVIWHRTKKRCVNHNNHNNLDTIWTELRSQWSTNEKNSGE